MKKIFFVCLVLFLISSFELYALDTSLIDMRREIFEESKVLKNLFLTSKDVILLNSMWDSCIMTVSQLDAYFMMVGIFNTIKLDNLEEKAISYLTEWLGTINETSELNLKSLNALSGPIEADTEKHILKLKDFFTRLKKQISIELEKIETVKKTLKIR